MKNKGFTLVELMGTMVVLAIVITIAISGFGNVRKNLIIFTFAFSIFYRVLLLKAPNLFPVKNQLL